MTESEANAIVKQYGYMARKVPLGFFIARQQRHGMLGGDMALVKNNGEIVPYDDYYGAQDHLAASALAGALLL